MRKFFRYMMLAMFIALSFLILNISNNNVIKADNPGNPQNYTFTVDGVFASTEDIYFYYVDSNVVTLHLDERIIDNPEVEDIVILEYTYGYDHTLISRGSSNFSSTIVYTMKNTNKELKNIQVILLSGYDIENEIPSKWLASMELYVYQIDALQDNSFILQSSKELNANNKYDINITFLSDRTFIIEDISYVDPFEVTTTGLSGTHFEVSEGGTYTFTLTDIFGNTGVRTVLVGYGRIDEVIIRSDDLVVVLGVPETVKFELDLIGLGVSIIDNFDPTASVEWYVDNVLKQKKTLENDGGIFHYNDFPNSNLNDLRKYKVVAKITNKTSNELTFEVINNKRPTIKMNGNSTIYLEAKIDSYVELGAIASDDIDGDITDNIMVDYSSFGITGLGKVKLSEIDSVSSYFSVFANQINRYTVKYQTRDSTGNYSVVLTRNVIVRDTIGPIITLNGPSYIEIEYGTPYVELGATAIDAYDGDVSSSLVIFPPVDTSTYAVNKIQDIIYSARDSSNNVSSIIRKIKFIDTETPIISIIGDNPMHLNYKDVYIERGARVSDNVDGTFNIQRSLVEFIKEGEEDKVVVDDVDTSILGTYYITYSYTDSSNNPAIDVIRTVYVEDVIAPTITLIGDSTVYIIARPSSTYVDLGYTATDNYDSEVTVVVTYSAPIDTTTSGSYVVYYNATDSHGNGADKSNEVTRNVIVLDTDKPIIHLNGKTDITYEAFSEIDSDDFSEDGIYGYTIEDSESGLVPTIEVRDKDGNTVNLCIGVPTSAISDCISTTTITTFTIVYSAIDSSNNLSENNPIRTINIVDTTKPIITLVGPTEIERPIGYNLDTLLYELAEATLVSVSDEYDDYHNIPIAVEVINYIDVRKVGTYKIIYTAMDSSGNIADSVDIRVVIIRDYAEPEIHLIGSEVVYVERGELYLEAGAYSVDIYDGTISISQVCYDGWELEEGHVGCLKYEPIKPTGMFKGTYTVTFYSKDSSENTSIPKTRTIHVIDTIPPIINGLIEDKFYYNFNLDISFDPNPLTDEVYTATLNDVLLTSPISLTQEGTYTLIVTDDFNNVTNVEFTIDKTSPNILGVENDTYTNKNVRVYADEEIDLISYLFEGGDWLDIEADSKTFTQEGTYQVKVRDLAENWSEIITFTIDTTPPSYDLYSLDGVKDKEITNASVSLIAESFAKIKINGTEILGNTYDFTENNYYRITIEDRAGNVASVQFTINKSNLILVSDIPTPIISQHSIYNNKVIIPKGDYSKGSGIIVTYPKVGAKFDLVSFRKFTDYELDLLKTEDLELTVNINTSDTMGAVFVGDSGAINALSEYIGSEGRKPYWDLLAILIVLIVLFLIYILTRRRRLFVAGDDDDDDEDEEETTTTNIYEI